MSKKSHDKKRPHVDSRPKHGDDEIGKPTADPSRAVSEPGRTGTEAAAPVAPELLAPVGHIESFFAAVENGADAVYLGLKQLSARASAANFSLEDLALLLPFAHRRKTPVYVALNSLITAPELSAVLDLLQSLADLQVDGLIVQDAALFYLMRRFFPHIPLHASTLMTIHNHAGVRQLGLMGAERVVLARELGLEEIQSIASRTQVPLEIFVHGALCYSYSGLCLASSFRGGHSGLQGRCVQPCRLRFRQGNKEGYFLSCGDLCALPVLPRLKRLRLAAFKIEGRMKSADYIARVVKAYRLVLDASVEDEAQAVAQAREWLADAPSRRLTLGFLGKEPAKDVLAPHRSGSSGLWVGTVRGAAGGRALVGVRKEIRLGDRLRPESAEGKEKEALVVVEMLSEDGTRLDCGRPGECVTVVLAQNVKVGERLFKIGSKSKLDSSLWRKVRKEIATPASFGRKFHQPERIWDAPQADRSSRLPEGEFLVLKVDSPADSTRAFQSSAQWVMTMATRANLERIARQRLTPAQKARFVWSLPPLIAEREVQYYRAAVDWLIQKGFTAWEVNNWGHLDFFEDRRGVHLIAGARFNIRNLAAMATFAHAGCRWSVLSLEVTSEELRHLSRGPFSALPVVVIHAWPPLFTSRLSPGILEEKPFFTPRGDEYSFRKRAGSSLIYADRPINWIDRLPVLRSMGYRAFMIDVSDAPREGIQDLDRLLGAFKRGKFEQPSALFNFERSP